MNRTVHFGRLILSVPDWRFKLLLNYTDWLLFNFAISCAPLTCQKPGRCPLLLKTIICSFWWDQDWQFVHLGVIAWVCVRVLDDDVVRVWWTQRSHDLYPLRRWLQSIELLDILTAYGRLIYSKFTIISLLEALCVQRELLLRLLSYLDLNTSVLNVVVSGRDVCLHLRHLFGYHVLANRCKWWRSNCCA